MPSLPRVHALLQGNLSATSITTWNLFLHCFTLRLAAGLALAGESLAKVIQAKLDECLHTGLVHFLVPLLLPHGQAPALLMRMRDAWPGCPSQKPANHQPTFRETAIQQTSS